MSFLTDIKSMLSTVQNVYIGNMPSSPDNCVGLMNSGGYARSLTGTMLESPTFQVRVRNLSYDTGITLCETIKDLLHGHSTTKILVIEQQGDILDIGRDELGRPEWTMNFRTYYRR